MEIETVFFRNRSIHAVEANDGKGLVFCPNAASESAFSRSGQRGNVEDNATNIADEFASNVVKLIALAIKPFGVCKNHAQENLRRVGRSERAAHVRGRIQGIGNSFFGAGKGGAPPAVCET